MKGTIKKKLTVFIFLAVCLAGVFPLGLGLQTTFDSWFSATARLEPGAGTWAFDLGYNSWYGLSADGEFYFIDSPFATFGKANEFRFNWYAGAGAYVRGLGYAYSFSFGVYPVIGVAFWWLIPQTDNHRLEVFLNYAPRLGLAVWNSSYEHGWYGSRGGSPVTFDWYGLANYRLGIRYHFNIKK